MKYYTGVGSRQTPAGILDLMTRAAEWLARRGWCLRSGGADGADSAFIAGLAPSLHEKTAASEIYLPWAGFNNVPPTMGTALEDLPVSIQKNAETLARLVHPAWNRCSGAGKKLHARNTLQVYGRDLNTPSAFVLCWTKDGGPTGGTGTAIRLANKARRLVFNLHDPNVRDCMEKRIAGNGRPVAHMTGLCSGGQP